ncbi:DUF2970 domain-containing protein [Pseudoalteromonas luteoviolacea]|uniref:DUF2970 domain-containing protein n=1 Tax=Pseudoalteromonas luteoviolacea NCIMB 1942 TaxID=1365253 RepID=A0A162ADZ0_9GAMM|nr:DUF2970 domain-containing protein [Pseudoalteromonas luteoviolacea]KZN48213.1 hypothetical protein N482_08040 [Pseudoalteromonas luteoviolacea NCIMB 1942]KZX01203.1 hypothetical protein JL49_06930 [Pseudoalteromonas luteoviolacea]
MTFINLIQSVLAAMFGVQSDKKYQFDFQQGRFWPYVVAGTIFVVLFVVFLITLVNGIIALSA